MAVLAAVSGCASAPKPRPDPTFEVQAGDYPRAFAAAKDVLRAEGFALERVDSARGVITTRPRASSGLATPWLDHSTTPGDAVAGVLHRERRLVEVRFAPDEASDLPADAKPIIARVEVTVQRLGAPGRRADASSIRLTTRWTEGQSGSETRELAPYSVMVERVDEPLSVRIANAIRVKAAAMEQVPPVSDE
jgi:hypothetical protein